jgi:hypothetical protein
MDSTSCVCNVVVQASSRCLGWFDASSDTTRDRWPSRVGSRKILCCSCPCVAQGQIGANEQVRLLPSWQITGDAWNRRLTEAQRQTSRPRMAADRAEGVERCENGLSGHVGSGQHDYHLLARPT